MYCRNCGQWLADDARFCSRCGTRTHIRTDDTADADRTASVNNHASATDDSNRDTAAGGAASRYSGYVASNAASHHSGHAAAAAIRIDPDYLGAAPHPFDDWREQLTLENMERLSLYCMLVPAALVLIIMVLDFVSDIIGLSLLFDALFLVIYILLLAGSVVGTACSAYLLTMDAAGQTWSQWITFLLSLLTVLSMAVLWIVPQHAFLAGFITTIYGVWQLKAR